MSGRAKPRTELLDRRYRLVEPLGTGGMSVVWRGYDEVLGRQVAIKVLNPRLAADRSFRHRIRQEAQAAARLCHPHIANVYDFGESTRRGAAGPYVVMELIDGESLSARLRRSGAMPWRDAVVAAAEVASALAAAHARGVVHRDVTPGNVMLTPGGAKVVDFGISAVVGANDRGPDGRLLGTPAYLAPERLDEGRVTPASDVYAVGLLLYRALTGRLPWSAPTTTEMLRAHLYAEPAPLPAVPGLPPEVAELCERCLAKDPQARPMSAELAGSLAGAVGLGAIPVSPAPVIPADADDDTVASTAMLPWSAATGVLAGARRAAPRDRVRLGLAVIGLMAVTGAVWGVTGRSPATGEEAERPQQMGMAVQKAPRCHVTYALRSDTGREFHADVIVTNQSAEAAEDWKLTFAFPDDQRVVAGRSGRFDQHGRSVEVRPAAGAGALAPGASAPLYLSGTYAGGNALPVTFELDGVACGVQVSGVPVAPTTITPAGSTVAGSAQTERSRSRAVEAAGVGKGQEKRDKHRAHGKG